MKEIYVKPQITIRNTCIKNYLICATGTPANLSTENGWGGSGVFSQLSKDRDDIWNSSDDDGSIW